MAIADEVLMGTSEVHQANEETLRALHAVYDQLHSVALP